MDDKSEQQPQSEVDRIVEQLKRDQAQYSKGEDPNSPNVTKRNIATNLTIITGRAQLWKMRNKVDNATELLQKGFQKMRQLYTPDELSNADSILDEFIKKEEKGPKILTDDIQAYRHILHEEKKD